MKLTNNTILVARGTALPMNDQIVKNLFEFWRHIGDSTGNLIQRENFSAVSITNSDWPNRIFELDDHNQAMEEVLRLSKIGELPEMLTTTNLNGIKTNSDFEFLSGQSNMALDLKLIQNDFPNNPFIKQVKTAKDSIDFSKTASDSFGYHVDSAVIRTIVNESEAVRLFLYIRENECLGCGVVYFDSNNNAGLHMIGTHPKGRRQGIGKSLTERLLIEAIESDSDFCVLHASLMGEPIYRKLGFESHGKVETYRILKNN
jgi:ribosomal protein S18 acetylase RimI-like enzyme